MTAIKTGENTMSDEDRRACAIRALELAINTDVHGDIVPRAAEYLAFITNQEDAAAKVKAAREILG